MHAQSAGAQAYPTKPVRVVIGFTSGTTNDIVGRIMAAKLGEFLGQSFVVENVVGVSGTLAGAAVARAAPDGHTLMLAGTALIVSPFLYQMLAFDPIRDFAPISLIASVPNVLVVNPSLPARTLKELISLARSQPGKLDYANSAKGGSGHLSMELLKSMARLDIVEVPYKSSSQALTDVVSGQVAMNFPSLAAAFPHIRSGRVRPLAMSGAARSPAVPDVPTVAEAGGLPGYEANAWFGVVAPAATRPEIITRLGAELVRALGQSDTRDRLAAQGAEVVGSTPAEFAEAIRAGSDKWGRLIRQLGLRLD